MTSGDSLCSKAKGRLRSVKIFRNIIQITQNRGGSVARTQDVKYASDSIDMLEKISYNTSSTGNKTNVFAGIVPGGYFLGSALACVEVRIVVINNEYKIRCHLHVFSEPRFMRL